MYRMADSQCGTFKQSYRGHAEPDLFDGSSAVCVKQRFWTDQYGDRWVYNGRDQLKRLLPEIQCLVYATALFNTSLRWIEDQQRIHGPPAGVSVPQMRFVNAYLAYKSGANTDVFLLEEWIDTSKEGKFVKYINNNSALPLRFEDEEANMRAEFLAFTQHVQYWLTGGLAFITDYQGKPFFNDPFGRVSQAPSLQVDAHC